MSLFLVDAQLPRKLAQALTAAGFDALHTLNLPLGNQTPDAEINRISVEEQRVLITKDSDFVESFLLMHQPYKLLLLTTGNIRNSELQALFTNHLEEMMKLLESGSYLELTRSFIIVHQ